MKMIVRADDVGYTPVNNIGAFETMEHGVVSAADVMLECPGTVDALERLKNMPWISVGWHTHFWGSPLTDPEKVPSIYDPKTGHFRTDLNKAEDVDEDELVREMYAQIERCEKILGHVPDTAGDFDGKTVFSRALEKVCDEVGIPHNFVTKDGRNGKIYPLDKWKHCKIYTANGGEAYQDLFTDSITEQEKVYDPYLYYAEDRSGLLARTEFEVVTQSWHPGYVDYYMYQLGDQGPARNKFTVIRTKDVEALTSDRMKAWVRDNHIELVNFKDALYGTKGYQNHLRFIGSDLYMG